MVTSVTVTVIDYCFAANSSVTPTGLSSLNNAFIRLILIQIQHKDHLFPKRQCHKRWASKHTTAVVTQWHSHLSAHTDTQVHAISATQSSHLLQVQTKTILQSLQPEAKR